MTNDSTIPPSCEDLEPSEPAAGSLPGVPAALAEAMRQRGIASLTSVQSAVLAAQAVDRDLRISSQTGSGKTVAIGLALAPHLSARPAEGAAVRTGPSVLVLVPTRELAVQVREELSWLFAGVAGIDVEVTMGGTSLGLERRALARRPRVVVGTPGRVLDHLRTGALRSEAVEHVVLDESDRMFDMGFREELEAILEQLPEERRTHLVSATFPAPVRRLADRFQRDPLHVEGTRLGTANLDIGHVVHGIDPRECYAVLVNLLLLNEDERCLVFVERRADAGSLAEKLSGDGFAVQCLSGELPQAQRTRTLNAFREGAIRILIATDVAARGIDVPDIELVIHVDPPKDPDSYVHRSGRTGRAGRAGRSVVLVPQHARRRLEGLLRAARIEAAWKPAPTAAQVHRQVRKRFRQRIHERLAAEEMPPQAQVDYAKQLLDGRDPASVVALLLELAQPRPVREPIEVHEPAAPDPAEARPAAPGFVRFTVNWGEPEGATPQRLLGHVCRRGQVPSHRIGAIEIGPVESGFEVHASVAARFEKLVQRPDGRDPGIRILRAGAPRGREGHAPRRGAPRAKRHFETKHKSRDRR